MVFGIMCENGATFEEDHSFRHFEICEITVLLPDGPKDETGTCVLKVDDPSFLGIGVSGYKERVRAQVRKVKLHVREVERMESRSIQIQK